MSNENSINRYSNRIEVIEANIKKLNNRTKQLKEEKQKNLEKIYTIMKKSGITKIGNWEINKLEKLVNPVPKKKKMRKKEKQEKTIEILRKIGVVDPNKVYNEIISIK